MSNYIKCWILQCEEEYFASTFSNIFTILSFDPCTTFDLEYLTNAATTNFSIIILIYAYKNIQKVLLLEFVQGCIGYMSYKKAYTMLQTCVIDTHRRLSRLLTRQSTWYEAQSVRHLVSTLNQNRVVFPILILLILIWVAPYDQFSFASLGALWNGVILILQEVMLN